MTGPNAGTGAVYLVEYTADGGYVLKSCTPEVEAQVRRICDEAERKGKLTPPTRNY